VLDSRHCSVQSRAGTTLSRRSNVSKDRIQIGRKRTEWRWMDGDGVGLGGRSDGGCRALLDRMLNSTGTIVITIIVVNHQQAAATSFYRSGMFYSPVILCVRMCLCEWFRSVRSLTQLYEGRSGVRFGAGGKLLALGPQFHRSYLAVGAISCRSLERITRQKPLTIGYPYHHYHHHHHVYYTYYILYFLHLS